MIQALDFIRSIALQLALLNGNLPAQTLLQPHDFKCVSRTAFAEARGEGIEGMALVVRSMMNRNTIKGTSGCKMARKHYDGYAAVRGKNLMRMDPEHWIQAQVVSLIVIMDYYDLGECSSVTHFLNPNTIQRRPSWASRENRVCVMGNHVAYSVSNI